MKPHLTVIAGPSGVGKGTVVKELKRKYAEPFYSVSLTTRPPREGEVNGEDYHFVTDEQFDKMIADDGFLEWALVHKTHRYGTPRQPVEEALAAGRPAILEIDLDGARQVKAHKPDALMVFLEPPSWEELSQRLIGRGSETDEQIARRLETARIEMAAKDEFDKIVINDDLAKAVEEVALLAGLA